MLSRRHLPLLASFPALYVGIAAVRADDMRPFAWSLVAIAVLIAYAFARTNEHEDAAVARGRIATGMGVSIAIATAALTTRPAWAAFAREASALVAMLVALRAVSLIHGDGGLAPAASDARTPALLRPRVLHGAAAALLIVSWGAAAIADGIGAVRPSAGLSSSAASTLAAVAGVLALLVLGGFAMVVATLRRLELAAVPRALTCGGACALAIVVAFIFGLTDVVPTDTAMALGGTVAAVVVIRVARSEDALALARRGRRALTLLTFGGPVAVLAALFIEGRPMAIGVVAVAIALIVGALSSKLEEPLLPVKGTLLTALAAAREAARDREARTAMADALARVRAACAVGLGPTTAPSPELWLLHPTRVMTVNAAGYLIERNAELPIEIFDVALGEPYGTVRTSVLRALEVRRADLRPLLAWLEQRDAIFATVVAESADPDGLLVVPAGARTEEPTLEEVRSAKALADAFVAISQATSAKTRHLQRELELQHRIDAMDDDAARLRHTIDLEAGRHELAATRLARPATVGIYSAASRMAYEALDRRISQDAPTVIVARAGIDPVPYVARAHLAGPRKSGPFVVVDGTSSREHDLERWTNERTSPLALADRGFLFLVDGTSLPREVQVLVARAVVERRPPWERATALDVGLALSATSSIEELLASGRLAPELAARFEGGEEIVLPGLRDRPEDLRSIVADRLAREGLRVHGRPIGIDAGAFARLVEHPWDGEDAELASVVTRLTRHVQGDVVRAADVDALGLVTPPEEPARRWPEDARAKKADG